MTAAERQRKHRRRRRAGLRTYAVEVDEFAFAEAVIEFRLLTESEALDPHKIEGALASVVSDWIKNTVTRNGVESFERGSAALRNEEDAPA